ncbi:AraC family transcriptional regulator [Paenibacillus sp.]|uniref:helix-turn-helix transcriptional regulator n=1 Tax=Paenibacillus sp. TaxID=58172 RepID=UPI0028116206|nr:AraC family transcriptional regulator [Paenibacillus sp.]
MFADTMVKLLFVTDKLRESPWEDTRRTVDCHTLYWVMSGFGTLAAKGERYRLEPGTLFYLAPGLELRLAASPGEGVRIAMALFDAATLRHADRQWHGPESIPDLGLPFMERYAGPERKEIDAAFRSIVRGWAPGSDQGELSCRTELLRLIAKLADRGRAPARHPMEEIVRRVRDDIVAQYGAELRIEELASRYSVSPSHLRKWFANRYGVPPKAYLLRLRMEHAARFLLHTRAPVKEIASECGFRDELHFSKAFKKHHGLSPAFYRSKLRSSMSM